ncbi:MAG: hypothetical protein HYV60_22390 [Planctomycetia bacterium]|nr:hypothetical protein [Planctomycetia bacterium]
MNRLAPDQNTATAPPTLSGHREACPAFTTTREELALLARHWCRIVLESEHFTHSRLASEKTDEYALRRIAELKDMLGTDVVEAIRGDVAAELMYELDE